MLHQVEAVKQDGLGGRKGETIPVLGNVRVEVKGSGWLKERGESRPQAYECIVWSVWGAEKSAAD